LLTPVISHDNIGRRCQSLDGSIAMSWDTSSPREVLDLSWLEALHLSATAASSL
jgi:hypothetical protein